MATVIVNHRVLNYANWKVGFEADEGNRAAAGIKLLAVGERVDDPGMVHVVFDVKNLDVLKQFMNNPELKQKMEALGVISAPEHMILN